MEAGSVQTETPRVAPWQIYPEVRKESLIKGVYRPDYGTYTGTFCIPSVSECLWPEPEAVSKSFLEHYHLVDCFAIRADPIVDDFRRSASAVIERSIVHLHHLSLLDKQHTRQELRISYRNPDEVMAYLERNPEIEGFLEAAQPELTRCFGGAVQVVLEVITYPDEADHHEDLVGWIQSADDINGGLDKLERFDDDWFLDHMDDINGKFNFNIETI